MQPPSILPEVQLKLLGCAYFGNPFHSAREFSAENEIGKLWIRFQSLAMKYASLIKKVNPDRYMGYEVHIESDEYHTSREYCVFVGIETTNTDEQPPELFVKVLPRTAYALVTTRGMDHKPVEQLLREWVPRSSYEQAYRYIIERYDGRRWRSLEDETSEIDWLIPVRRRNTA